MKIANLANETKITNDVVIPDGTYPAAHSGHTLRIYLADTTDGGAHYYELPTVESGPRSDALGHAVVTGGKIMFERAPRSDTAAARG